MLIKLIDWPGTMPTTHVPDVDLVIAFRASCPASLNTTHVRTLCKAEQQYTQLIETLTYASLKAVGQ